jgi:putative spermidine/putrescine transport system ATP-binding protein
MAWTLRWNGSDTDRDHGQRTRRSRPLRTTKRCCLLGPSGCGKTSTLRMIAGHEVVSDGRILLGGRNITALPAAARGTAMMFQSYALFPHLSALDNVAFSLKMRGVGKAERRSAGASSCSIWSRWSGYAERRPAQLSGGQQQRVALARALITEPQGAAARRAAVGARSVPARADARRAEALADRTRHHLHPRHALAGRGDGAVGPGGGDERRAASSRPAAPREVFNAPATEFVARFIGGHNVFQDGGRPIALRTDRTRIVAPPAHGARTPRMAPRCRAVVAVEYQGTLRAGHRDADAFGELAALVTEARFYGAPVSPGEPARSAGARRHPSTALAGSPPRQ